MAYREQTKESKKVTLSLPVGVMDEVRQLVKQGAAPSHSAFVIGAFEKDTRVCRKTQLQEEFHQAAGDPDFLQDVDVTMEKFATADAETARMIP